MVSINKITLPHAGLDELVQEARADGYDFLDVLERDWADGSNRFDDLGEVLCGAFDCGKLIAVGGLNRDPFVPLLQMGRIRRVYVRSLGEDRELAKRSSPPWSNKLAQTFTPFAFAPRTLTQAASTKA